MACYHSWSTSQFVQVGCQNCTCSVPDAKRVCKIIDIILPENSSCVIGTLNVVGYSGKNLWNNIKECCSSRISFSYIPVSDKEKNRGQERTTTFIRATQRKNATHKPTTGFHLGSTIGTTQNTGPTRVQNTKRTPTMGIPEATSSPSHSIYIILGVLSMVFLLASVISFFLWKRRNIKRKMLSADNQIHESIEFMGRSNMPLSYAVGNENSEYSTIEDVDIGINENLCTGSSSGSGFHPSRSFPKNASEMLSKRSVDTRLHYTCKESGVDCEGATIVPRNENVYEEDLFKVSTSADHQDSEYFSIDEIDTPSKNVLHSPLSRISEEWRESETSTNLKFSTTNTTILIGEDPGQETITEETKPDSDDYFILERTGIATKTRDDRGENLNTQASAEQQTLPVLGIPTGKRQTQSTTDSTEPSNIKQDFLSVADQDSPLKDENGAGVQVSDDYFVLQNTKDSAVHNKILEKNKNSSPIYFSLEKIKPANDTLVPNSNIRSEYYIVENTSGEETKTVPISSTFEQGNVTIFDENNDYSHIGAHDENYSHLQHFRREQKKDKGEDDSVYAVSRTELYN